MTEWDPARAYSGAEKLVTRYRRPTDSDFDDLVQEAVVSGWRAASRESTEHPVALSNVAGRGRLYQLFHGASYTGSTTRRGKRPDAFSNVVYTDDFPGLVASRDDIEGKLDVRRAVAALPAELRELVWLIFWQGLSEVEVARQLGRTRWWVQSRLRTALEIIRLSGMVAP